MRKLRFVVLGDPGVGRTTLIESYVLGTSTAAGNSTRPRSFVQCETSNYHINVVVEGCPYSLQFYDPESDIEPEELELLLRSERPDAVILMYDISNTESYSSIEDRYRQVRHVLPTVKCVLVANKLDLRIRNPQRLPLVTVAEGNALSEKLRMRYFIETSGINLRNVSDLIDQTVRLSSPALSEINLRFSRRKGGKDCVIM
jgi:small GTP-binding protein